MPYGKNNWIRCLDIDDKFAQILVQHSNHDTTLTAMVQTEIS